MKLLLCVECSDVRAIGLEPVSCRCGRAIASIQKVNPAAKPMVRASEYALIIGIEDSTLRRALSRKIEQPGTAQLLNAFLLPEPCKSVRRVKGAGA
jgi:hypothetical protein